MLKNKQCREGLLLFAGELTYSDLGPPVPFEALGDEKSPLVLVNSDG